MADDDEDPSGAKKFEWMQFAACGGLPQYVRNTTSYSAAVLAGQYVYVVGDMGREMGSSARASGVCRINSTSSKWTWFDTVGPRPTGHVMCLYEDGIYVYSGVDANKVMRNDVWKLDLLTMEWIRLRAYGGSPLQRSYASGGLFERTRSLVVFGGEVSRARGNKDNRQTLKTQHVQVVEQDKFLSNQVWQFDLENLVWNAPRIRGKRPCPRFTHDSVVVDRKLYVFGGSGQKHVLGDLHVLHQWTNNLCEWSQPKVEGSKPKPVYNHSITFHAGKLFLFGGYSSDGCSSALSIYDPAERTWFRVNRSRSVDEAEVRNDYTVLGRMNRTSSHTAVATPMGILVLGGVNRKFKLARMLTSGSRRPSQCARRSRLEA